MATTINLTYPEAVSAYLAINGVGPELAAANGIEPQEGIAARRGLSMTRVLIPLRRMKRGLEAEIQTFEEARETAVKQAIERVGDGAEKLTIAQLAERDEELAAALNELNGAALELRVVRLIPLAELEAAGLSLHELENLWPLLETDDEDETPEEVTDGEAE